MSAREIRVIETNLERRGKGVKGDPVRRLTQYWTLEGKLLAEVYPFGGIPVSKTASDRIKEIYSKSVIAYGEDGCQLDDYTTKVLTKEILDTLGITIEGINEGD